MSSGTVYWITGLSGAGKTTIGKLFYEYLKKTKPNIVFLDGDMMREVFLDETGHTIQDRKKLAMRYSRLCKMLADQEIDVICATISMFCECWDWNRKNIAHYKEIYLRVPIEVLIQRDQKELYSRALNGEMKNVIGIDIPVEEPYNADIIIDNIGKVSPENILKKITAGLEESLIIKG